MPEYEVVVIGGGMAGLTGGLFAARYGRSTLVLVADVPGGHLCNIERVEDFPGFPEAIAGFELGPKLQQQAASAGAEFRMGAVTELKRAGYDWIVATGDGEFETRAVILATGSRPRKLGIPGEDRFEGHGISHCASCDGPLLHGDPAVVVGGGDSAFQEALSLAGYASEVAVVHRFETSPAQTSYQQRVREHAKIDVHPNTDVLEILGDGALTGVRVIHQETRRETHLPAAGVWVYVGLQPNSDLVKDWLTLEDSGHVPTDIWLRTARRGLFAAGDVRMDSAAQAVAAAGDGATAAIAAHRYLDVGVWPAS